MFAYRKWANLSVFKIVYLKFNNSTSGSALANLYDLTGRLVLSKDFLLSESGLQQLEIPLTREGVLPGIYSINLNFEGRRLEARLVVVE